MFIRKLARLPRVYRGDAPGYGSYCIPIEQDIALRYSLAHAIVPVGEVSTPHFANDIQRFYYILEARETCTLTRMR